MTDNQSIIVYRSRWERDADQFWSENPEILLGILGAFLLVLACFWVIGRVRK